MYLKNHLLVLALLCLVQSCFYQPTGVNVPMLTEKGEIALSGTTGFGNNIQAAYGLTDHLGVIVNYNDYGIERSYNRKKIIVREGLTIVGYNKTKEIGFGYFNNQKTKKIGKYLKSNFDIYGGFGAGNYHLKGKVLKYDPISFRTTSDIEHKIKIPKYNFFIQPNFAFSNDYFDFILTPKTNILTFEKVKSTLPLNELNEANLSKIANHTFLLFEPAATMRLGIKAFMLQGQVSNPIALNHKKTFNKTMYQGPSVNFGVIFKFKSN